MDTKPEDDGGTLRRKPDWESEPFGQAVGLVGLARVSTSDQNLDRQVHELEAAGCTRIFKEHGVSGVARLRPGLDAALDYLRAGDTLVVTELSRIGRSTAGVVSLLDELRERAVGVRVLGLGLDTSTATGRLVLSVLAAVAEMERSLIIERVHSGVAEAQRRGVHCGRPAALTRDQRQLARELVTSGRSVRDVGSLLGCSERTVRRAVAQT